MDDWAGLLNNFPGAVRAVTGVVGEIGHSIQAWLHTITTEGLRRSRLIEERTEAQKKINGADCEIQLVQKKEQIRNFTQRAKINRQFIEEKHQQNREFVMSIALCNLLIDMPDVPQLEEPSDDWLDLFGCYAEKANSDTMRQHWARILEGEIRKPGSFSFCTLQLASMLDQSLAAKIERVSKWVVEGTEIPHIPPLTTTSLYDDIMDLDSVGFLTVADSLHYVCLEPESSFYLNLNKSALKICNKTRDFKFFKLPCYLLTIAGREIFGVITVKKSHHFVHS